MSAIIGIVAHDIACKKGDEWVCHSMAKNKEDPKGESDIVAKDEAEDVKTDCIVYCVMLLVIIGLLGIYYLIAH